MDLAARLADALERGLAPRPWFEQEHGWHRRACPTCGKDHARPSQLPPEGDWFVWLILAGRGWGKTRTGAEWLAREALRQPNSEWAVIAPKFSDARSVCVEGQSGLLTALGDDHFVYNRSNFELRLSNGAKIFLYGAEDIRMGVRGRNLWGAWCDELASWPYEAVWREGLIPALRMGERPRVVVTTTPRRVPLVLDLASGRDNVVITRGATFENEENLSSEALLELHRQYDGTTLGRQELYGEILDELKGALWTRETLMACRAVRPLHLSRIVVAIDPAVTSGETSDETGIVVAGLGDDGHGYILEDLSCRKSPDAWAKVAVEAYHRHRADRIVGEVNNGGEMVGLTISTADVSVPFKAVHASRGKRIRAEPVAALYEQGRIHHTAAFPKLEDQMATFLPEVTTSSPDRVDALVWAITELMLTDRAQHALYVMRELLDQQQQGSKAG